MLISHARWVHKHVSGDEDVLIFEYGEAEPGDIDKLARFSRPHYAFVTGLAPAHLDGYASIEAIVKDFKMIQHAVEPTKTFVNQQDKELGKQFNGCVLYGQNGTEQIKIKDINISLEGMKFRANVAGKTLEFHTGLLGKHHLGPLCAVMMLAEELGLTYQEIQAGVARAKPFEHRMQPRHIHGAWIIDDTYNGNIEGMRAGLELLKDLPGKRKIYVTPGLVDQGVETEAVHTELGTLIAHANPDKVVLMQNSVTEFIATALKKEGYKGDVQIEANPLEYYTNIEHFLAAGDVIMLQNDWPDSYK